MGTRSHLVVKCPGKKDKIILYTQFDGYLKGQGDDLCKKLKKLLDEFTIKELIEKVLVLKEHKNMTYEEQEEYENYEEDDKDIICNSFDNYNVNFTGNFLYNFITGKRKYNFERFSGYILDIEYTYTINFENNFISVDSCHGPKVAIPFKLIKMGINFSDFADYFYNYESDEENEN